MKREGKQHGKVRIIACKLPPGNGPRTAAATANGRTSTVDCQTQEPPPMAGAYAKTPAKNINHSKHPGKCKKSKCRECHHAAAASKDKPRDKGKGALKLRSSDVLLNHRLASWRVVDTTGASSHPGFSGGGASASELLRQLSASRHSHEGDDRRRMELLYGYGGDVGDSSVGEPLGYGYDDDCNADENVDCGYGEYYEGSDDHMVVEYAEAKQEEVIGPGSADDCEEEEDDADDADNDADVDMDMDYFVVGVVSEYSDEDWFVVQEM